MTPPETTAAGQPAERLETLARVSAGATTRRDPRSRIRKAFGILAYALFLAVFVYLVLFLAGVGVPKGIDDGQAHPVWLAVVVDVVLLVLFAVQHSVMARPWFKRWWTRFVAPSIERSTYVVLASAVLALLVWQWRPLPATVWSVEPAVARTALWAGYASGWAILVSSTFLLGHFELFGLRQVRNRATATPAFREPFIYRYIRHPLMVGFLIAFWSTPDMSVGRLLLTVGMTGYIVVAVRFEEHDLRRDLGDPYERYVERVPRFVPASPRRRAQRARAIGGCRVLAADNEGMTNEHGPTEEWSSGDAYEGFVGRWSRVVADDFVAWLDAAPGGRWLDVGAGTGALSTAVVAQADPVEVVGIDRSEAYIAAARRRLADPRASFEVGDVDSLAFGPRFDAAVAGLVLNFLPDPASTIGAMRRAVHSGGTVAAYVWDYAGRMEMLRSFWDAAAGLDAAAADLDEGRRFPLCDPDELAARWSGAGLGSVATTAIDVPTDFADFDDFWAPFLDGQGPAPGYVTSLPEARRVALREAVRSALPVSPDGAIGLIARAWAVRGTVP